MHLRHDRANRNVSLASLATLPRRVLRLLLLLGLHNSCFALASLIHPSSRSFQSFYHSKQPYDSGRSLCMRGFSVTTKSRAFLSRSISQSSAFSTVCVSPRSAFHAPFRSSPTSRSRLLATAIGPSISMSSLAAGSSSPPSGSHSSHNATHGDTQDYDTWVKRLYTTNLYQPVKMGLDNIQRLYNLMGRPLDNTAVIHIAGTNGKGSVALKMAKTLEAAGREQAEDSEYKVGLFVSPHIASFRERIQVNGRLIEEEDVVKLLPAIYQLCHAHSIPATFFELTTALAMQYFGQQKVNAVVLETGLGGRLDATNILTKPALTIVTSIGLEHTRILGDTLPQIAREKAGIFKQGRPVLVGPVAASIPEVDETLRQCAAHVGAEPYYTCQSLLNETGGEMAATDEQLMGEDYDIINSRIVRAAVRILQSDDVTNAFTFPPISEHAVLAGTSQRPPCRFEHVSINNPKDAEPLTVILDVAHNPEAMEYLVSKLKATYKLTDDTVSLRIVLGMSSDKDLNRCARAMLDLVHNDASCIHLVQAASPRAATLKHLLAIPGLEKAHHNTEDPSVARQVQQAVELSMQANEKYRNAGMNQKEILVVCGSVFIMADARQALGINEPKDSDFIAQVGGPGARNGQENFGDNSDST